MTHTCYFKHIGHVGFSFLVSGYCMIVFGLAVLRLHITLMRRVYMYACAFTHIA